MSLWRSSLAGGFTYADEDWEFGLLFMIALVVFGKATLAPVEGACGSEPAVADRLAAVPRPTEEVLADGLAPPACPGDDSTETAIDDGPRHPQAQMSTVTARRMLNNFVMVGLDRPASSLRWIMYAAARVWFQRGGALRS